eukprot:6831661-Alexandrium_andersonii.AAC.1
MPEANAAHHGTSEVQMHCTEAQGGALPVDATSGWNLLSADTWIPDRRGVEGGALSTAPEVPWGSSGGQNTRRFGELEVVEAPG